MTEFTVKEVTVLRVATFLNEARSAKYIFFRIYEIFNMFDDSNFDIDNYCSFI